MTRHGSAEGFKNRSGCESSHDLQGQPQATSQRFSYAHTSCGREWAALTPAWEPPRRTGPLGPVDTYPTCAPTVGADFATATRTSTRLADLFSAQAVRLQRRRERHTDGQRFATSRAAVRDRDHPRSGTSDRRDRQFLGDDCPSRGAQITRTEPWRHVHLRRVPPSELAIEQALLPASHKGARQFGVEQLEQVRCPLNG